MCNRNPFKILFFTCCLIVCSAGFSFSQHKRNSRPATEEINKAGVVTNINAKAPVYFYEFANPEFTVSKILIEHDENGEGRITFQKKDFEEDFVEPLKLSVRTLEKLKTLWAELKFLESDENYQSKDRDYGHLGTMKLKMKKESKTRIVEFNWTENLTAKALTDEYRKIGNQSVWMFDMKVAREYQPNESPKIMKGIDSYLRRNEISDPNQLIPYLKEISNDERFPLITRNHAARLLKQIEKAKAENK